ncbi:hypothetical protein MCOR07_003519 [Pyricularia oryzae]|nr:hypothetical protein MCOR29_005802 [Pyricularia oryzae]KAI6574410.1 hypothetical protein MCOR09_002257 [Pyricularia oryzae]KAI6624202.1 hypothetical protein MCOR07_003519 [Pyricularia oryzae]
MSAATITAAPVATAASQAGIFEGMNPTVFNPSDPIVLFIIQATIVIGLTRLLYWPLAKIHEPKVIAEVITGIILGPSVMGRIPGFTATIFPPASMAPFRLAANIGLVLYLFLVGLEIDLSYLLRNWRIAVSVASFDMAIPFGLGVALAYGLYNEFKDEQGIAPISFGVYALFIGIAIAITAFPVLCRILTSLKLLNSNVGVIVLTSGIINDVVGWILLALCVTLVNSGAGITALYILLVAVGFSLFLAYAVRPVFMWVLRRTHSLENGPTQGVVALTIFMVLASAFFTSITGVHSIFGAFMVGLMCPHQGGFAVKLTEKIEDLVAVIFVPLFFALSGIKTNLGLLDSGRIWAYVFAVIFVAFFSKLIGGTIGARLNGLVWRESFTIGTLMSCKGLVELIVLNIGREARILSTRTFTIFVVMALVTTFLTSPLVMWLYPPSYQQKLELWKQGKIDWDGNPIHPSEEEETGAAGALDKKDIATRLLVYIRADGLSSVLSTVSLFTSAGVQTESDSPAPFVDPNAAVHLNGESMKEGITPATATLMRPRPERLPLLRVHGYRLVELSERNSSVMQVADIEQYAAHDPIIKAFGTSANTASRDVVISGKIAVVPQNSFADTLADEAGNSRSDLILVPWSETGSISEVPSLYGGVSSTDPLCNDSFAQLATGIFDAAKNVAAVGVYLDRTLIAKSDAGATETVAEGKRYQLTRHTTGISLVDTQPDRLAAKFFSAEHRKKVIRVFFAGTEDDLFAVRLALQLSRSGSTELQVTICYHHRDNGFIADFERLRANIEQGPESGSVIFTTVEPQPAQPSVSEGEPSTGTTRGSDVLAALAGDEAHRNITTILIVGRTSTLTSSEPSEYFEVRSALGNVATRAAAEIRRCGAKNISILVVQARKVAVALPSTTSGPSGQTFERKASHESQASDIGEHAA